MCTSKAEYNFQGPNISKIEDLPLVLTVSDVSKVLGIGKNTTYDLIRNGAIKSVRVGRQIRVPKSAFLEFLGQKD